MISKSALSSALQAAARRFDGRCDHRAAAHLNLLFLELFTGKSDIEEPSALAAHAGIEAFRCSGTRRHRLIDEEHCSPGWTPDMLLYVVSALLLCHCAPAYCARVGAAARIVANCALFTARKAPSDLTPSQLRVCALVLVGQERHSLNWLCEDVWTMFQALEIAIAREVARACSAVTVEDIDVLKTVAVSGKGIAPPVDFASRASLCSLALAVTHARAARCMACTFAKQLRLPIHESANEASKARHHASQRTWDMAEALRCELARVFEHHAGDEQDEVLTREYFMRHARATDPQFAAYCLGNAKAARSDYEAALALWPPNADEIVTSRMPASFTGNDTQILVAANCLLARIMPICRKCPWNKAHAVSSANWILHGQSLLALRWHRPVVVDTGPRFGNVLLYWHNSDSVTTNADGPGPMVRSVALDLACTTSFSKIEQHKPGTALCVILILWMRARVAEGRCNNQIKEENGTLDTYLKDLANGYGVPRGAVA